MVYSETTTVQTIHNTNYFKSFSNDRPKDSILKILLSDKVFIVKTLMVQIYHGFGWDSKTSFVKNILGKKTSTRQTSQAPNLDITNFNEQKVTRTVVVRCTQLLPVSFFLSTNFYLVAVHIQCCGVSCQYLELCRVCSLVSEMAEKVTYSRVQG